MYAFNRDSGIGTIDCQYVMSELACAYIMVEGDEVAFIENNTSLAHPHLMSALAELGLRKEQVKYAIITHVHLDHAGGSGLLARECPNAMLLAHPRAGRHLVDPARLIASSIQVYGEDAFRRLYGEILPVPEDRLRLMGDGEELQLGSRTLSFLHTRGHANHHMCIFDSKSRGIFTGDTFGIAYPELQGSGPWLYPTSTPTEFDPGEARVSMERILATGCSRLFLTHFGEFSALREGERLMREGLLFLEGLLDEAIRSSQAEDSLKQYSSRILDWMMANVPGGVTGISSKGKEMMRLDAELNAQGLVVAAMRRKKTV